MAAQVERDRVLRTGFGPVTDIPPHCLHEWFEAVAAERPGEIALVLAGRALTYRELNRRANQVAHRLRQAGVGAKTLVAVAASRSVELVAGIFGVLKAGAAYVPVDASHPAERIRFVLDDTSPLMVLTQQPLVAELRHLTDVPVLPLDDEQVWQDQPDHDPEPVASQADPAYVIYTSGSTGQPKGVVTAHRAIVNRIQWMQRTYLLTGNDVVLQKTPYTFDVSVWEFFWPLSFGARLVLAEPNGNRDPMYLAGLIESEQVTICHFVPSMLRVFLAAPDVTRYCASLRDVICSGEALTLDLQRRFFALLGARLHNLYGPTEAAIDVTAYECRPEHDSVPIGRAIDNVRVHVLDDELEPLPFGAPGELFIGGAGLATGYLNRPSLTADRFIRDRTGERLYRTGDRALMRPDGTVEYLGRLDHQVKIRGLRVELGEVESVLLTHPAIHAAAVTPVEAAPGDQRLVAYVVLTGQDIPDVTAFLEDRLPEYMVPTVWHRLDEMPLTSSGKVDRGNLPAPDLSGAQRPAGTRVAPRTPIETALAELWGTVLGRDDISRDDDFFALGGNSLLAASLATRVHRRFGAALPMASIFEKPVLTEMAEAIGSSGHTADHAPIPVDVPADRAVPLSSAQQRFWFLEQLQPGTPTYNLPMLFSLRGPLDATALHAALTAIVERHDVLRTIFIALDGQPYQKVRSCDEFPLTVHDLRDVPADRRDGYAKRRVEDEAWRPFDLEAGPLIRSALVRLTDEDNLLLVTVHHIVFDGWSETVFLTELTELYQAIASGAAPSLPPLPVRYRGYALWQRNSEGAREHLSYWEGRLKDCPALVSMVPDLPRPVARTFSGRTVRFTIPAALAARLRKAGRRERVTLYMVLLAAFQLLIARHSGETDIVVGSPVANRGREETEGLVGLFLNTLVLRTDLSGAPTVRDLLRRVRKSAVDAFAHQDVPFEDLVQILRPDRQLDRTPLFQVLFNLIPPVRRTVARNGLRWQRTEFDDVPAKYDLSLYVWDGAEELDCALIYNADLFLPDRMRLVADQYLRVLEQITELAPTQSTHEISLLTGTNRQAPRLREPLTAHDGPDLARRCAELASRYPDRQAIVDADRTWTYRQVDAAAAEMADWLRARDIGPGTRVAVLGRRTGQLACAMLAVMRAEATVALLDATLPAAHLASRLETLGPSAVIDLDGPRPILTLREPPTIPARSDAGAGYILFTSGSTGTPKAVLSDLRSLSRFLAWQTESFGLTERDRFSVLSGLGHDPVLRDVFGGLVNGAEVHCPTERALRDPAELVPWLRASGVTVAHLTPPLVEMLTTAGVHSLPAIRLLFFGGARLTGGHVNRARAMCPNAEIVNFYGTTETPQAVSYYRVPPGDLPSGTNVPIGRGAADAHLVVLGEGGHVAGIGEIGEIMVRSPHLALGCLAGADEGFSANPFRDDPADRVYHTGDLGRYLPDGDVQFLGRRDRQVNVRGHRVEPAEIEAVLLGHPDVWEAAVHGPSTDSDERLRAWVVPQPGAAPAVRELRDHLTVRLPEYMVPRVISITEVLPLTSNGKIDYAALSALALAAPEQVVEPVDEVESRVAELWAQIIGEPPAHREQSFFDVGHSLLAVRFVAAVQHSEGVDFSLRRLFESPSWQGIAGAVRGLHAVGGKRT
jgi:amino acid adenylation domain-containing protein